MKMKKINLVLLFIFLCITVKSQENFDQFISKFAQDSIFQYNRILFPLHCVTWNYDDDTEFVFTITINQWKFDKLFYYNGSDAYSVFYDNFDCKFRETDEMVFRWRGITDMDRRYYFKRINDKWYLVKILDYDMKIPKKR